MSNLKYDMYHQLISEYNSGKPLSYGTAAYWTTKLFTKADQVTGYAYASHHGHDPAHDQMLILTKNATEQHHPLLQKAKKNPDYTKDLVSEVYHYMVQPDQSQYLKYMLYAGLDRVQGEKGREDLKEFSKAAGLRPYEETTCALLILKEKAGEIAKPSIMKTIKNLFSFSAAGITSIKTANKITQRLAVDYN